MSSYSPSTMCAYLGFAVNINEIHDRHPERSCKVKQPRVEHTSLAGLNRYKQGSIQARPFRKYGLR